MEDQLTNTPSKLHPITLFAGGCLAVLYLALCGIGLVFGGVQLAARNIPTPTPSPTPAPRILVHSPADQDKITHEDFSSNQRNWGLIYSYGKLQIIDGKLILQSNVSNGTEIGTSEKITPTGERYYLQADFSTDIEAASSYGLVFGMNRSLATYYLFTVWPRTTGFSLFKYNAGNWTELVPFSAANLSPYPQANTLGVSFDKGAMELYINGTLVSEYSDGDFFQSKDVGVYVNNGGFQLFVDDFFIYDEK
jgi:hypothetical protein